MLTSAQTLSYKHLIPAAKIQLRWHNSTNSNTMYANAWMGAAMTAKATAE